VKNSEHARLIIPEYYDRPCEVSEVWTVKKSGHVATCRLRTHPLGAEARVDIDGEWQRGEAGRDGLALVELAIEWKDQFVAKGWT
jgi:hypothetical protein